MDPIVLTPQQRADLCRAIGRDCTLDDLAVALDRHPGDDNKDSIFPVGGVPMLKLAELCIDAVSGKKLAGPFLSRVLEHKWKTETLRSDIIRQVPILLRPPDALAELVAAIKAALEALLAEVAEQPAIGAVGNVEVFRAFCTSRAALEALHASLLQFDALKALHDSLHVLQVQGAEWLDAHERSAPDVEGPLTFLVSKAAELAATVRDRVPDGAAPSAERCADALATAQGLLNSRSEEDRLFALATLRALLMRELPLIDDAMFVVSRDLPLKQVDGVFETSAAVPDPALVTAAGEAAYLLGETLRGRIMEHALWQATDLRLYAIEEIIAQPTRRFLKDFVDNWKPVGAALAVLMPAAAGERQVHAGVREALTLFEQSLPRSDAAAAAGGGSAERLAAVAEAFKEFCAIARLRFLAVDQRLKADFGLLLSLRGPLALILDRVPLTCGLMVDG